MVLALVTAPTLTLVDNLAQPQGQRKLTRDIGEETTA